MQKILLDTDIGTDVDDAVCLAYLLSHPACELLGITTVTGEAGKRAELASVLSWMAGKEIPIFPGAEQPLRGLQKQLVAQQAAALHRWPHETHFPSGQAVDFLARTIQENPGEVTLLAVGPMTNIGTLFRIHPEIPSLLKAFVMMGGVFNPSSPEYSRIEWNVSGDPEATGIVYRSPVALHRSVGLDVTQKVVMPAEEVRQRFTSDLLQPVKDFAEIWFHQFYPSITFHDPLAAATIFTHDLCTYQEGTVEARLEEQHIRTVFHPGGDHPPHQVAASVDVPAYFEHFFKIMGA